MSQFSHSIGSNVFVTPSVTTQQPDQAPTAATPPNVNNAGSLPPSNNASADPARLQLLQFGTQAKATAARLRQQAVEVAGIQQYDGGYVPLDVQDMLRTIPDHIDTAVDAALNTVNNPLPSHPEAEQAERKRICMAILEEINRFTGGQDGGALQHLFDLLTLSPQEIKTATELLDHSSAETLKSHLDFLAENVDLWFNDREIDTQILTQCMSLLSAFLAGKQ